VTAAFVLPVASRSRRVANVGSATKGNIRAEAILVLASFVLDAFILTPMEARTVHNASQAWVLQHQDPRRQAIVWSCVQKATIL
jgi:hypothetical protein